MKLKEREKDREGEGINEKKKEKRNFKSKDFVPLNFFYEPMTVNQSSFLISDAWLWC